MTARVSADDIHRAELEILDEVGDGLGQDVVTPDGSAEHLNQASEKQSNCRRENLALYLERSLLVEA